MIHHTVQFLLISLLESYTVNVLRGNFKMLKTFHLWYTQIYKGRYNYYNVCNIHM